MNTRIFSLSSMLCLLLICFGCNKDDDKDSTNNGDSNPTNPTPDHRLPAGQSARAYLSGDDYSDLSIQIVNVNDYALSDGVIESFEAFIETYCDKNSVSVSTTNIASGDDNTYTLEELKAIEEEHRRTYIEGNDMALYIFVTNGSYSNDNVLGLAYYNTSFAIMGGKIRNSTGDLGQPSENLVLQTVLRHEMGHLLGLVDNGSPMQTDHIDEAHGNHCTDSDCLMYYTVETGDFLTNLVGENSPPALDANCQNDLEAGKI